MQQCTLNPVISLIWKNIWMPAVAEWRVLHLEKKEASFKSSYQVCTVVSAGIKYIGSHMLVQKIWLTSLPQTELNFGSLCRLWTVISNIMLNIRNESKRPWQEPSRKSSAAETSHPKMEGGVHICNGTNGMYVPQPFCKAARAWFILHGHSILQSEFADGKNGLACLVYGFLIQVHGMPVDVCWRASQGQRSASGVISQVPSML